VEHDDRINIRNDVSLTARVGVWQPFAAQHLWAARLMTRLCRERENRRVAEGLTGVDFQVRSFAVTAIMESVATLEARVNEVWEAAASTELAAKPTVEGLTDETIDLLCVLRRTASLERSLSTLEKFDVVLACARKPATDKGRRPYQHVEPLIRLRNALVHFTPEMHWSDEVHYVEKRIAHLLPSNPLLDASTRPWFPNQPLCAGVAEWAWRACKLFVDEWEAQLGLAHRGFEGMPEPWPDENP
jgi:hypothetical protein